MKIWLPLLCGLLASGAQARNGEQSKPSKRPTNPTDAMIRQLSPTEIPDVKQVKPIERQQTLCLALGIYHEARSEPSDGQRAVGHVILNRVKQKGRTICQTILEHGQFAPTIQHIPNEIQSWQSVQREALALQNDQDDNTKGATMFYNLKLANPNWAKRGVQTARYGDHVFMRLGRDTNTLPLPFPVEPESQRAFEPHRDE